MPWDFWLIFLVLGILLPWRGVERMRHLMLLPEVSGRDRIKLYLLTILFQWVLALMVLWRAFARGLTLEELAVRGGSNPRILAASFIGAGILAAAHTANIRRMGRSDHPHLERLRALGSRLFPRTAGETALFVMLALTAGICEEFLFRGFVIAALLRSGVATWFAVVFSATMFGVAHLYQGRGGSIGTGLLGTLFALVRIAYHSLVPAVVWHAALDVAAGIAGTRFLIGASTGETKVLEEIHR
jgi:membrane protease YdiL (CAAX protease family)